MQIESEALRTGDVVSRVSVAINTKDVFDFGEQISREVVKQLADVIADDLAARSAKDILSLIDMDAVAQRVERRVVDILSAEAVKAILGRGIINPEMVAIDCDFHTTDGVKPV